MRCVAHCASRRSGENFAQLTPVLNPAKCFEFVRRDTGIGLARTGPREYEMAFAQRLHPSEPRHPNSEALATVWVMIAILLGLICFAFASLLGKI